MDSIVSSDGPGPTNSPEMTGNGVTQPQNNSPSAETDSYASTESTLPSERPTSSVAGEATEGVDLSSVPGELTQGVDLTTGEAGPTTLRGESQTTDVAGAGTNTTSVEGDLASTEGRTSSESTSDGSVTEIETGWSSATQGEATDASTGSSDVSTSSSDVVTGPGDGSTSPGDASTSPGNASTGPGDVSTSSSDASTDPGSISSSSSDVSTAPGDVSTSPGDASTGPGDVSASPGDVSTGPGDGSSSSGDVSTGPGVTTSVSTVDMDTGSSYVSTDSSDVSTGQTADTMTNTTYIDDVTHSTDDVSSEKPGSSATTVRETTADFETTEPGSKRTQYFTSQDQYTHSRDVSTIGVDGSGDSGANTLAIALGVSCGVLLIVIVIILVVCMRRRALSRRRHSKDDEAVHEYEVDYKHPTTLSRPEKRRSFPTLHKKQESRNPGERADEEIDKPTTKNYFEEGLKENGLSNPSYSPKDAQDEPRLWTDVATQEPQAPAAWSDPTTWDGAADPELMAEVQRREKHEADPLKNLKNNRFSMGPIFLDDVAPSSQKTYDKMYKTHNTFK